MNKQEATDLVKQLVVTWPRPEIGIETIMVYRESLEDLPYDHTAEAIRRLRASEDWMPSVAKIRRKVYGIAGFGPPHLEEAIEQAHEFLRYQAQRSYVNGSGYQPTAPPIHPLVASTITGAGAHDGNDWEEGFRFVYKDNLESWKNAILSMNYNDVLELVFGE